MSGDQFMFVDVPGWVLVGAYNNYAEGQLSHSCEVYERSKIKKGCMRTKTIKNHKYKSPLFATLFGSANKLCSRSAFFGILKGIRAVHVCALYNFIVFNFYTVFMQCAVPCLS